MLVRNTTAQNKSKYERLSSEHVIPTQNVKRAEVADFLRSLQKYSAPKEALLYSIGCFLLRGTTNRAAKAFMAEYDYKKVSIPNIPTDEFDLLGSAYQFLNTKIENLEKGCFYTGRDIAQDFVRDLDFSRGQTIFDPACGSGAFFYNSDAGPEQIIGVDIDEVAVMIAKFNYFIKFPNAKAPKIFCDDFFAWYKHNKDLRFDYIIGNPPYGATIDISQISSGAITSGESFSYFIEFCFTLLKKDGVLRFLLPEALLNVKRHTDVRTFILQSTNLERIKRYRQKFSSVMSDVYMLELNAANTPTVLFVDKATTAIPLSLYEGLKNNIFAHLTTEDIAIIEKVTNLKKYDLSTSVFGLGVVTGDNKTKIYDTKVAGSEPIYTGKEVGKYRLSKANRYLVFDRNNLQQVAPDEIYRAPEKLVYKTINKLLKVALDTSGALTTNSANIIIPKIAELDVYTILALLNSDLYSYLHLKLFGGVNKIAKENLMALPLPGVSPQDTKEIKRLVKDVLAGKSDAPLQAYIERKIFNLTDAEVAYVRGIL
jgi:type I restriction-modification system DNA methylase subunit